MSEENNRTIQAFDTRQFYETVLEFVDSLQLEEDETLGIVAYQLQDGSIKCSKARPFFVMLDVMEESRLSDRLLVIVSVAYLEDQLRLLLAKFLADDEETEKLLDAEGGSLLFLSLARLAFASGLIAKEWLEMLKEMAALRNKFAHIPAAQSFEDLKRNDKKRTEKTLNRLFQLHKAVSGRDLNDEESSEENLHGKFAMMFQQIYTFLQFSIDHRTGKNSVRKLTSDEIIGINHISGFTKTDFQQFVANFDQGSN